MTILLFGMTKDIVGNATIEVSSLPSNQNFTPKNVGELRQLLVDSYPALGQLSSLAIAVNNNYAADDIEVDSFDEIALIPPVSGG